MSPFFNQTTTTELILEYYADDKIDRISMYEMIAYGVSFDCN